MTILSDIKLYATTPHKCSYLEKKEATTLFVDPDTEINEPQYVELSELGFRRSGQHFYRPHCQQCEDCIPARVPVNYFSPSRRQRRVVRRNSDIAVNPVSSIDSDEHYDLYSRYICHRHETGDMYPPSRQQFDEFLVQFNRFAGFVEFRLDDRLVALSVCDDLGEARSAIYTAFDPDYSNRSLGNFVVLKLIERAREAGRDYLYLGYWIKECRKMRYKIEYRPIELYIAGRWRTLN